MFGGEKSAFSGAGQEDEEIFLNLTPMIDILTCLLFFLLLSFGAVIIALISASVPVISEGDPDPNYAKAKVTMGLQITESGFIVTASHDTMPEAELAKLKKLFPRGGKEKAYDYKGLHEHLWWVKKRFPNSTSIIITPAAKVTYDVLVQAMDASRDRPGGTKKRPIRVPIFPDAVVSTIVE
jgi:biopolymer transport protein ExbD